MRFFKQFQAHRGVLIMVHARGQTFPVTEEVEQAARPGEEFHVLGIIERQTLLKMLAQRIGFVPGPAGQAALPRDKAGWESLSEALEQRPLKADPSTDQAAILGCAGAERMQMC